MPEYPILPDPRADIVAGTSDYSSYQKVLPELYLKSEVPEIVKEQIRIAGRVLEHSYFVYEFIDVAFMQVLFGFEKALRLRYRELEGKDDEKLNLFQLSQWAKAKNFFELADQAVLNAYRKVRNGKVHEPKNSLGGTLYLQKITEPVALINDLYEDVDLRVKRRAIWEGLFKDIVALFNPGATLAMNTETIFIRNLVVPFVNNKRASVEYYFTMVVLTEPSTHKASQLLYTRNLIATDVILDVEKRELTGTERGSNTPFVISALDVLGIAMLKFWENQIAEVHRKEDGEHAMTVDQIASISAQIKAEELHRKALFDFYKA